MRVTHIALRHLPLFRFPLKSLGTCEATFRVECQEAFVRQAFRSEIPSTEFITYNRSLWKLVLQEPKPNCWTLTDPDNVSAGWWHDIALFGPTISSGSLSTGERKLGMVMQHTNCTPEIQASHPTATCMDFIPSSTTYGSYGRHPASLNVSLRSDPTYSFPSRWFTEILSLKLPAASCLDDDAQLQLDTGNPSVTCAQLKDNGQCSLSCVSTGSTSCCSSCYDECVTCADDDEALQAAGNPGWTCAGLASTTFSKTCTDDCAVSITYCCGSCSAACSTPLPPPPPLTCVDDEIALQQSSGQSWTCAGLASYNFSMTCTTNCALSLTHCCDSCTAACHVPPRAPSPPSAPCVDNDTSLQSALGRATATCSSLASNSIAQMNCTTNCAVSTTHCCQSCSAVCG